LTGGLVGGIAFDAGLSTVAAGAWGGAAGGAVTGFGSGEISAANGDGTTQAQVLLKTAEGAAAGAAAGAAGVALGPTVPGGWNFDPFRSPATWGSKAWQLYWQSAISAAICLASRKC
jgi:hypothetical protein